MMSESFVDPILDELKIFSVCAVVSFGFQLPIIFFPLTNAAANTFFIFQIILFFLGSVMREFYIHTPRQTPYIQMARAAVNYFLLLITSILVHITFSDLGSSPYFYGGFLKSANDLALARYFCSYYHCAFYAINHIS